jgi:hypothetical protein
MQLLAALLLSGLLHTQDVREVRIGISTRIDGVVLPGSEFEAAPIDARSPLVLRVRAVWPHGSDLRYDLEFYALDPGEHELTNYLRRKDGTAAGELPSIPIRAVPRLPEGQVKPHSPEPGEVPSIGGYKTLMIVGAIAWVAGLVVILLAGRKRRAEQVRRAKPLSMAEELRPLIEAARARSLSSTERSQLELRLVAFWRHRMGLELDDPVQALAKVRADAHAGALLRAVEQWLHAPDAPREIDIEALLKPYREEIGR